MSNMRNQPSNLDQIASKNQDNTTKLSRKDQIPDEKHPNIISLNRHKIQKEIDETSRHFKAILDLVTHFK